MNLKELAKNYGIEVNEDSCPIHIFKELDSSIEKKYKVGQIILPYCKYEDCEHCWQIELQDPKEEWIAEITEIDSEIWNSDIEGNTKEEVIKEGIKYSKAECVTSFRVGQKIPVSIPSIDVEEIINNAYNQVYDEVGECAEGFLDNIPEEQEKELENQLNDVFYNWIKKYKLEPNCYNVINDEVIEVEETNKDCTCKLTMMELDKPNKNCNYVKAGNLMNKLDIKKLKETHSSRVISSKEALKDVEPFFDVDCCNCRFFDGICCMYDCKSRAMLDCEDEAKNCNHYSIGKFNWDELEKSNYK